MTRDETASGDTALARREGQRLDLIRKAAGVDRYIGQGAPGYHFGRYVCLDCPDDRHQPPFRPFRLDTHIHQHLAANPQHRVSFFCWDDGKLENTWHSLDGAYRTPDQPLVISRPPNRLGLPPPVSPMAVLAALETLRKAGYTLAAKAPKPSKVYLLPHEAETLAAIKKRAGITLQELSDHLGVSYSTARNRVRSLVQAGHVGGGDRVWEGGWQVPRRLSAAHERPISIIEPRQKVRGGGRRRKEG